MKKQLMLVKAHGGFEFKMDSMCPLTTYSMFHFCFVIFYSFAGKRKFRFLYSVFHRRNFDVVVYTFTISSVANSI